MKAKEVLHGTLGGGGSGLGLGLGGGGSLNFNRRRLRGDAMLGDDLTDLEKWPKG